MTHHPHLHRIVPGGGLSLDGKKWLACRPGFFLPVRVLSRLFLKSSLTRTPPAASRSSATYRARQRRSIRHSLLPRALTIHCSKCISRFALNFLNLPSSKSGLLRPHAQRIDPVLNTFAPALDTK